MTQNVQKIHLQSNAKTKNLRRHFLGKTYSVICVGPSHKTSIALVDTSTYGQFLFGLLKYFWSLLVCFYCNYDKRLVTKNNCRWNVYIWCINFIFFINYMYFKFKYFFLANFSFGKKVYFENPFKNSRR